MSVGVSERAERRTALENEFLPAALEILETPPSPLKSAILVVSCSLVLFGLLVSWFGRIDVVASAQAQIVPGTRAIPIRSLTSARISKIYVQQGQTVESGQPLMELDPTDSEVDLRQVEKEKVNAGDSVRLLRVAIDAMDEFPTRKIPEFQDIASVYSAALATELRSELSRLHEEWASLNHERTRLDALAKAKGELVALYEKIVPLREERHGDLSGLLKKGGISREDWVRHYESFLESQTTLNQNRIEILEIAAQRDSLDAKQRGLLQDYRRRVLERITEEIRTLEKAENTLQRAQNNYQNTTITAPENGIVHQLVARSPGAVVNAGETLMIVIPNKCDLEIQAKVLNQDIGWVHPGQVAKLKVASFPYTRHGMVSAKVRQVGADGVVEEHSGEVNFPVVLTLDAEQLRPELLSRLSPGMSGVVEMRVSKRRLLEVWLSPLQKHVKEAFREN